MNKIKLPVLYCPFPSAINQHGEAAGQHTLDWVRSFNLVTDESAYQTLRAQRIHDFAARTYPNASLEALEILSDYLYWTAVADGQFEKAGISKQPELLSPMHARLVEILKGAELTDVDTPVTRTWRDIVQRLHHLPHGTSELMLCFAKNMEDYFQAVRQEATNHSQGITPELVAYMKLRSLSVAVYPFFDLYKIVYRITLAPEVIEHPIVKRLELATNNVVAWGNDILGVEREMREGNTSSLVLVLQHEYQISFQEALERAASLRNAEMQIFLDLSAQLPSFGAEIDANLQSYLSGLRSLIGGSLNWYLETTRYRFTGTEF